MRKNNPLFRWPFLLCAAAGGVLAISGVSFSQSPVPPVSGARAGAPVRITFLPPPMQGTLSLGVYDRAGKLVRTLHREAAYGELAAGLNGLITEWDGCDDSGQAVSPGKYRVRGVAVGELETQGEAYYANDWVTAEDAPRPVRFHRIQCEKDAVVLWASDLNGKLWRLIQPLAEEAQLRWEAAEGEMPPDAPAGPGSCAGREGTRWSIERVFGETVVVQFDAQGEVLRKLSVGAGQPVPVGVAVSPERDAVFLLEQEGEHWRLRGLRRKPPGDGASPGAWETLFEKNRWPCGRYAEVAPRTGRANPLVPEAFVPLKTQPNPLLNGAVSDLEVSVDCDAEGGLLKTKDGLVLRRLSDARGLKWAVLAREARQPALVFLQSDGAVVEEFRVLQPGNLMTFDAGEYQWPSK